MKSKLFLFLATSLFAVYSIDAYAQFESERPDAYLEWLRETYSSTDTGVIRVVDAYMNQNPEKIETLTVTIYSEERESEGIIVELIETYESAGIFEGTMFFTTTDTSSGHRLHVIPGDLIIAEYTYSSDPTSNVLDTSVVDEIQITGIPSLKTQLDRGTPINEIQCPNPEHVLAERPNEKTACVKQSTAEKLNWTLIIQI